MSDIKCKKCLKIVPEAHQCNPVDRAVQIATEIIDKELNEGGQEWVNDLATTTTASADKDNCIVCTSENLHCSVHESKPKNKYMREILPKVWVDVYDVIDAFEVTDGGMQHALKKILATGKRGHKDEAEDRKDILASVKRSNEIFERKQ